MPKPKDASNPGINKPTTLGSRPSGKKQDKYNAELKAYDENEALKK